MPNIIISAQNFDVYDGDGGPACARTGATTLNHLVRAGANGVILGHSEVDDTLDVVRQKLLTIANSEHLDGFANTTLLLGESWSKFEHKTPDAVAKIVSDQLRFVLQDVPHSIIEKLVIGYEPKWGSRSSGRDDQPPPTPDFISAVCSEMRATLQDIVSGERAAHIPLIYGGRSTTERTMKILKDQNINGLILGSACDTVEKTMDIAKAMRHVQPTQRKIMHLNFKAFDLNDSYNDYIHAISRLDDSFTVYISPNHTDIREVKRAVDVINYK